MCGLVWQLIGWLQWDALLLLIVMLMLQWDRLMSYVDDNDEEANNELQKRIAAQAPNRCCMLIYTVRWLPTINNNYSVSRCYC